MKQLRKLLSIYVAIPVLVVAVAAGVNCGNDTGPQVVEEMAQDGETATSNPTDPAIPVPMDPAIPVLQSDLEITRLEVTDYGSELLKGFPFSVLVQVTNQGQAASGEYTVEIWEEYDVYAYLGCIHGELDDTFISKTMMHSYTMGSLAPGETHTIEKEDALLNIPTWHTISAEITPIGWQESKNFRHVESLDIRVW